MLKSKKYSIFLVFFLICFLILPTYHLHANTYKTEKEVVIKLANFPVHFNGTLVNQVNNSFPLIVYNDITYVPMTWHDCRYLGLSTDWSGGFIINKSNTYSPYTPYYSSSINDLTKEYTATFPDFTITVNGRQINNSDEPYPLLVFKHMTYFPLTWRFAVDEFDWEYKWSTERGLEINTPNKAQSDLDSLISIINQTAYSDGYSIEVESSFQDELLFATVNNKFIYKDHPKDIYFPNKFNSHLKLDEGFLFRENLTITEWDWSADIQDGTIIETGTIGNSPSLNDRFSLDLFSNYHPLREINQFFITTKMRSEIKEVKLLEPSINGAHYEITFNPDSNWGKRRIEVVIDWKYVSLKELIIEDINLYDLNQITESSNWDSYNEPYRLHIKFN